MMNMLHDLLNFLIQSPIALYLTIGVLGLCVGSFLNVVIYRTPKMMEKEWRQEWHAECQLLAGSQLIVIDEEKLSLSQPASTCPKCKTPIRWYQNIPIISWLVLRGKCASCQNPI
ncbi:prepilin peptidase, partial [Streptococcus agalactiae]|uniref:prepilin peptidase n=1 Tax=Streptococcus agalactiae TaxID=1311 RepID=UPI003F802AA1